MKRIHIFILISALLFACSPASAGTVTVPVEVTVTSTHPASAEVTVNSEAGTIAVGGQVINTPSETQSAPTVAPETLLPPDFTVANWTEFRTKILPYCSVRADLRDDFASTNKLMDELRGWEIGKQLFEQLNNGIIANFSVGVAPVPEGGGCALIGVFDKSNLETRGFFQSRLDLNKWIEVKFTDFQ